VKQIPNIITLLNLFCGCIAIVYLLQNGIVANLDSDGQILQPLTTNFVIIPSQIWLASLFIGIAAVVDFFDGFVARLFGASSEMGKQLDSLADVVSFGVAPGMILYQLLRLSIAKSDAGMDASVLWLMPAFILPCAAAYRLARFNIDTSTPSTHFRGVPVPAVGLTVASFPMIYWHATQGWVLETLTNKWFVYVVVALLSWLMISSFPIISNKLKNFVALSFIFQKNL
jgi:CDP-diacylglycerol--serine O-phosphatidyltransferase